MIISCLEKREYKDIMIVTNDTMNFVRESYEKIFKEKSQNVTNMINYEGSLNTKNLKKIGQFL